MYDGGPSALGQWAAATFFGDALRGLRRATAFGSSLAELIAANVF